MEINKSLELFKDTKNKYFFKVQGSEQTFMWEKVDERMFRFTAINPYTDKVTVNDRLFDGGQMLLLTMFLVEHQRVFWSF